MKQRIKCNIDDCSWSLRWPTRRKASIPQSWIEAQFAPLAQLASITDLLYENYNQVSDVNYNQVFDYICIWHNTGKNDVSDGCSSFCFSYFATDCRFVGSILPRHFAHHPLRDESSAISTKFLLTQSNGTIDSSVSEWQKTGLNPNLHATLQLLLPSGSGSYVKRHLFIMDALLIEVNK